MLPCEFEPLIPVDALEAARAATVFFAEEDVEQTHGYLDWVSGGKGLVSEQPTGRSREVERIGSTFTILDRPALVYPSRLTESGSSR
jgi:hypothetical protein